MAEKKAITNTDFESPVTADGIYYCSFTGLLPVVNATDVFTVTVSATKIVEVFEIGFSMTKSTSLLINVSMLRRSTANSGGISTLGSFVPRDSMSLPPTSTAHGYTSNPTLGSLVGSFVSTRYFVNGAVALPQQLFFDFKKSPIILRGVNEVLSLNLAGFTNNASASAHFYVKLREL